LIGLSGFIELKSVVKVKIRVRVSRVSRVRRVSCKVNASLRISEKPEMTDPWNGGPKPVRGQLTAVSTSRRTIKQELALDSFSLITVDR